jgi:hypothetical protein
MSRSMRMWWFACVSSVAACADSPDGGASRSHDDALVVQASGIGATTSTAQVGAAQAAAVTAISSVRKRVFDEDDARLLLALSLKHLCSLVSGCGAWLGTALHAEYGGGSVTFSAAVDERIAARVHQLQNAGNFARAKAVEVSYRNLMEDLRAVSSIGLDGASVQAVVQGLLPVQPTLKSDRLAISSKTSAAAPVVSPIVAQPSPATSLGEEADAFVLELFAAALGEPPEEGEPGACEIENGPVFPVPFAKGGSIGGPVCGRGAGFLDSALDPSCQDLAPYPDPWYCSTAEANNEYGSSRPHLLQVGFAVSARRCEPCQDGSATGTLVPLRNSDGSSITICDTSAACQEDAPDIGACRCLGNP